MKRDQSRLRHELRRLEAARESYVNQILAERGPLRRGSFVTVWRKCGKPTCHCAKGSQGHPGKYLSRPQGKYTYVPSSQHVRVAQEAERYRRFRQARAMLAKLTQQALAIIDALEQELQSTAPVGGQKKKRQRARRQPGGQQG
jgi:hypothetical protein